MRIKLKLLYPFIFAALLAGGLAAGLSRAGLAAAGPLCYVNAAATGAATGLSWTDAYTTVQDALADAACAEIWVAKGVYYPDEGPGQTNDNINSRFAPVNNVSLYGGFAGGETTRSQRDPAINVTVLSGDIDHETNPDITDVNGVVTDAVNIRGQNSYVVFENKSSSNSACVDCEIILDGFTITAGRNGEGSGIYNENLLYLVNFTLSGNYSSRDGGGLYNVKRAGSKGEIYLTNGTISGNTATYSGGGIYIDVGSFSRLTNVTLSGNTAAFGGGIFANYAPDTRLFEVTISGNTADHGAAISSNSSYLELKNVTVYDNNTRGGYGGGIYSRGDSLTLYNVTIFGNNAPADRGGGIFSTYSALGLYNTIFANNAGGDCIRDNYSFVANNNLIEDTGANACSVTDGVYGNIVGRSPDLGPLTDYGAPGRQVFPLLPGSLAIDAGTSTGCPATDQRGVSRPQGAGCDIGAYEMGYNLTLSKQVDNPAPLPGQTVTFTLIVANTDLTVTNGLISDTLPAGLNFVGPVTLEPAGAGNAGAAPPTLASGLTISNGQRITVTFPVTVSYGLAAGTVLTNTAAISGTQIPTPTTASTPVIVSNAPPAADAGAPQTVNPGGSVTLDGSASSDPNGDVLTYQWTQTGGPAVSLSDATAVKPVFMAPGSPAVLTFTLTVTDSVGAVSALAVTAVNVTNYTVYLPLVARKP